MINSIEILSSESLEKLRNIVQFSRTFELESLDILLSKYDLKLITSDYQIDSEIDLLLPEGVDWSSNNDKINSLLIYKGTPKLTAGVGTDERLWVTLSFGLFANYSKARWLKDENDSKSILNHWFAPTSRSRWRDHCVSRLWHVGHFAHSVPDLTASQVLEVLYWNSELINSFLGRPRTTSSRRISGIILSLLHKEFSSVTDSSFNRVAFREFMKEIDLQGGKRDLDLIPASELETLISRIFEVKYLN
jgi:hypothetical protein